MNPEELSHFLRQTLADHKFTPSEKAALTDWLAKNVTTGQEFGVARHTVFEVAKSALGETANANANVIDWLDDVMRVFLSHERLQLRDDEEKLETQMREMDVSLAKERALLARQETALTRLRAEIQHELELIQRGDPILRDALKKFEQRAAAVMGTSPIVDAPKAPKSSEASLAFFSPGEHCLKQIVHRFMSVRHTADVCVFTITDDRISWAIEDAHRRGVKIRVISDHDKAFDQGSDIQKFREAGIPVKTDDIHKHSDPGQNGHMHHKFAIFDGIRLINGSYNWTRGAANMNYENIVDTVDAKLIAVFAAEFERLWNRF